MSDSERKTMALVIGGSGSGKSAYAEQTALSLSKGEGRLYYLAAMQAYGEEGRKRVERHRQMRDGKGFLTVEQPVNISESLDKMEGQAYTVLLECISNLLANEMFSEEGRKSRVSEKIIGEIKAIKESAKHFVVVSNNVFEDGRLYDEGTMAYMREMGKVNQELAAMADQVIEVVVGIPVRVK